MVTLCPVTEPTPPLATALPTPLSPRRRRAFRFTAAVVLPLLLILGLECALRLAGWERIPGGPRLTFVNPDRKRADTDPLGPAIRDDRLFWRSRPGWTYDLYAISAQGYRTPLFTENKEPGSLRVVCLGDSSTFGLHVAVEEAWPRRLETLLRRRLDRDDVEVINLAVPGYTSFQGLRLYRDEATRLDADVVVAAFGSFNDWVPAVGRTDASQDDAPWWEHIRVVQLVFEMAAPGAPLYDAEGDVDAAERRCVELDTRELDGPRRVPLDDYVSNLRALASAAHEGGARFVLMVQPLPPQTLGRNPIASEYAGIALSLGPEATGESRNSRPDGADAVVDGRAALLSAEPDTVLFSDFCHPSPEGHRLLAEAAADAVVRALE